MVSQVPLPPPPLFLSSRDAAPHLLSKRNALDPTPHHRIYYFPDSPQATPKTRRTSQAAAPEYALSRHGDSRLEPTTPSSEAKKMAPARRRRARRGGGVAAARRFWGSLCACVRGGVMRSVSSDTCERFAQRVLCPLGPTLGESDLAGSWQCGVARALRRKHRRSDTATAAAGRRGSGWTGEAWRKRWRAMRAENFQRDVFGGELGVEAGASPPSVIRL
eukprot:4685257-Pleurochrysis_carterae.AAC.6